MRFPRWLNVLLQVSAMVAQVWQILSPQVTWEEAGKIGAAITAFQAIVAAVAHSFNTDGTPQTVAFVDKK
jgi:hypothetical protein